MIDWSTIRHFDRAEWKHDPDRIEPDVVMLLDEQRDAHEQILPGVRYVIHVAWDEAGHVENSGHYTVARELAVAVDYHMEVVTERDGQQSVTPVPLLEQWLFAEKFSWNGIGVYPFWNSPGLHCDLRRLGREHPNLGKRWWRDLDPDPKKAYKALDRGLLTLVLRQTGGAG